MDGNRSSIINAMKFIEISISHENLTQYEITCGLILMQPVFSKMGGSEVPYQKMNALLDYIVGQKLLGKYCGLSIVSKAYIKKIKGRREGYL